MYKQIQTYKNNEKKYINKILQYTKSNDELKIVLADYSVNFDSGVQIMQNNNKYMK